MALGDKAAFLRWGSPQRDWQVKTSLDDAPSSSSNNPFISEGERVVHHIIHYTDKYNFLDVPETWGNETGLGNEMVYVFQYKQIR